MLHSFKAAARLACLSVAITPAFIGAGHAATSITASIQVTANVLAFCIIGASPLAFGNYTANAASAASTNVTATCTKGTAYTIALDAGTGTGGTTATRVMNGTVSGSTLQYTLSSDSGHQTNWGNTTGSTIAGTGNGTAQSLPVYGLIGANQYVAPGNYTDTVTATLTY